MKDYVVKVEKLRRTKLILGTLLIGIVLLSMIVKMTVLTKYYIVNLIVTLVVKDSVTLIIMGAALIVLYKIEEYIYMQNRTSDYGEEEK